MENKLKKKKECLSVILSHGCSTGKHRMLQTNIFDDNHDDNDGDERVD